MILPLMAYAILFLMFQRVCIGRREAALIAGTWWTLALVILTETLSMNRSITQHPLAAAWLLLTAIFAGLAAVLKQRRAKAPSGVPLPRYGRSTIRLSRQQGTIIVGGLFICSLIGITAAVSPPNGSDQLQYHLPRVIEWASRHSVGFFPTQYYVQLFAPPLAEWMMLHSYVLSGGDRLVGMVQWLAFLGSAIAVSLVAKELGAVRNGQILAAFLCVTLPQGVLAASGAKNDWVLSLWIAAAVFFLFRWLKRPNWFSACNLGISIGAALLAKGSVYAFMPPVVAAVLALGLRSNWKRALLCAPIVITAIVLMNGLQWARNFSLGGSILGLSAPDVAGKEKYSVDRVTLRDIAANVFRESAMHLGTPFDSLNDRETDLVRKGIALLGVDPDDRASTNYGRFQIPHQYYSRDEYYAGNPFHLVLIVCAFTVLVFAWPRASVPTIGLALGIAGGFVLYCSLFKWEIWCARLHLPLFVLACAVVAVVVCERFPKTLSILAIMAFVSAIPPALCNTTRPLLFSSGFHQWSHDRTSIFLQSRNALYFTQQTDLRSTYVAAAEQVRSERCNDIGMDTSIKPYSHEYPLMELSRNPGQQIKFRYVEVDNLSSKYADRSDFAVPCVVICPECRDHKEKWDRYLPTLPTVHVFGNLVVFSRSIAAEVGASMHGN